MCVYVVGRAYVILSLWNSEDSLWESVSYFTMWVPGVECMLLGLVLDTFAMSPPCFDFWKPQLFKDTELILLEIRIILNT